MKIKLAVNKIKFSLSVNEKKEDIFEFEGKQSMK